jgi:adenosylcobinamide-GDP ribazoletransferase
MKEIIAAFIFFTRLPLWPTGRIPADCFKHIVVYWPLTGLLTGAVMTGVYLLFIFLKFHAIIAVIMAFISRLLLTGALHEDGLADFFDGFGGGRTREQTLSIMKDSRTGSYGVLGLTLYILLWVCSVFLLVQPFKGHEYILFFTCDVWSKWCASQIINILPYARNAADCKIKQSYERMSPGKFITGFVFGILPFTCLLLHDLVATRICFGDAITIVAPGFTLAGATGSDITSGGGMAEVSVLLLMAAGAIFPVITMLSLVWYMKHRIRGYTGDCCGAMFLLCELSYLLALDCLWKFI